MYSICVKVRLPYFLMARLRRESHGPAEPLGAARVEHLQQRDTTVLHIAGQNHILPSLTPSQKYGGRTF